MLCKYVFTAFLAHGVPPQGFAEKSEDIVGKRMGILHRRKQACLFMGNHRGNASHIGCADGKPRTHGLKQDIGLPFLNGRERKKARTGVIGAYVG